MLSRLSTSPLLMARGSNTLKGILQHQNPFAVSKNSHLQLKSPNYNLILKRSSGHNAMVIEPSNWAWKYYKNAVHFWVLFWGIPIAIAHTIISIRMNPELTEVPEGYQPRHWEYEMHPLARFMSKYLYYTIELEDELFMADFEDISEANLMLRMEQEVEGCMKFYNDSRSKWFRPGMADYFRKARYQTERIMQASRSDFSDDYEKMFDDRPTMIDEWRQWQVPVEGYKPESMQNVQPGETFKRD